MASLNEITPMQLMRLIGTPTAPTIVDVCTDDDFAEDPRLIPTSIRAAHRDMPSLLARLGDSPVVVACQKGKKLSQQTVTLSKGSRHLIFIRTIDETLTAFPSKPIWSPKRQI